eukprot:6670612-Lingulodinium_polyedra.AAC.1
MKIISSTLPRTGLWSSRLALVSATRAPTASLCRCAAAIGGGSPTGRALGAPPRTAAGPCLVAASPGCGARAA